MLINMRNGMMAGKRLPYDAEVEYLESTGTQWIDTGILANGEFDFDYTFRINRLAWNTIGIGARSASQFLTVLQINQRSYFAFAYMDTLFTPGSGAVSIGTDYNVRVKFSNGFQSVWVNGLQLFTDTKTGVEALNLPIYLFKRSFYGESDSVVGLDGRIYSCKIWQNGVLVRDFIPVRVGNVGYMYDRVSGRLFGNEGTVDFVLGPDVVPVEYIESHGTEWIDTGVKSGPSNLDFTVDCSIDSRATNAECGSGVNAKSGLHYVLDNWGIRTGGGVLSSAIPYTLGTRVKIRAYYNANNERTVQVGSEVYQGGAYNADQANLNILRLNNTAPLQVGKLWGATVSQSGDFVRSFRPVRVGSGSTWEGAMMDVLTRRIYRNAGTGAFGYGNDLKYPIPAE